MKDNITKSVTMIVLGPVVAFMLIGMTLSGCQATTKELGGTTPIKLDPGVKLEEITWKDSHLWYLTRPMREGETAETHRFEESSNFGIIEGTVIIMEQEKE